MPEVLFNLFKIIHLLSDVKVFLLGYFLKCFPTYYETIKSLIITLQP